MPELLRNPLAEIPYTKGFYVYILRCQDDSLYTGWTTHLRHRFHQHAIGKGARYTRARRPLELYYFECHADKQAAMRREYQIAAQQIGKTKTEISQRGCLTALLAAFFI